MVEFLREEYVGRSTRDEPLTLTRWHSYMKPLKGRNLSVAELQLKGIKGKFFSFLFSFASLLL